MKLNRTAILKLLGKQRASTIKTYSWYIAEPNEIKVNLPSMKPIYSKLLMRRSVRLRATEYGI
jgi:hypothetical protein